MVERVDSRERNPQNPRNPTKTRKWENTPNPKPQTTRIQDPTKLLVGEGERGKQRSQDPQMGTSLAPPPHELVQEWSQSTADSVQGRCSRKKIDDETFRYPTSASTRERKKPLLTDNFSNCRVHRNDGYGTCLSALQGAKPTKPQKPNKGPGNGKTPKPETTNH